MRPRHTKQSCVFPVEIGLCTNINRERSGKKITGTVNGLWQEQIQIQGKGQGRFYSVSYFFLQGHKFLHYFSFAVLGIKPRALHTLDKCSTTESHTSLSVLFVKLNFNFKHWIYIWQKYGIFCTKLSIMVSFGVWTGMEVREGQFFLFTLVIHRNSFCFYRLW
jgi:hypothetical protein